MSCSGHLWSCFSGSFRPEPINFIKNILQQVKNEGKSSDTCGTKLQIHDCVSKAIQLRRKEGLLPCHTSLQKCRGTSSKKAREEPGKRYP